MTRMTQTQDDEFVVDQLVRIKDQLGWFWIVTLPTEEAGHFSLYGGTVSRGGGIHARSRYVRRDQLEAITTPGYLRKAEQTRHAIREALQSGPRPHSKKPGKK